MNFVQSFRLAIKSLLTSKMRALLTMLGIIIGVGAVIIITSLGNGMETYMNDRFEQMGSNLIEAMIYGTNSSRTVDDDDMYALVAQYPQYFSGVTPYLQPQAVVRRGNEEFDRTKVYGVGETFYNPAKNTTMQGETLGAGRFLTYVDVDKNQSVCVVGAYIAQQAFGGNALGKTVTLSGLPFTIVGVLEQKGDLSEGSGDDVVYIPYSLAQRVAIGGSTGVTGMMGGSFTSVYMFTSVSRDTAATAKGLVENRLYKTFQSRDQYFVFTSAEMMDTMNAILDLLMTILTIIAAISLLVGGIGIMNIMLVSVTERTREIGIRKSLGAKRRDVRSQFIIEAGTTSAIGGLFGIGFGILMANVFTVVLGTAMGTGTNGFRAVPTLGGILVAFGVSVAIGVLFGFLPANKAAKLNPIDALRYD